MERSTCTFLAIVLAVACAVLACSEKDDVKAVHDLIDQGQVLAEAHDISGLMDLATHEVRAMPMGLDRRRIKGVLWQAFNHYGPLKILYPRPQIDIDAESSRASAQFPFLIVKTGQSLPDLEQLRDDPKAWVAAIGETADLYRLQLELIRREGRWRASQVVLERFTGLGFK